MEPLTMDRRIAALGALLASAALAACGGAAAPAAPAPTVVPVDDSQSNGVLTVALNHMPHGLATITSDAGGASLSVSIHLYGLVPGSTHPAALDAGSCLHQGATVQALSPMVADDHGVADVTSTVSVGQGGIPGSGRYLEVLNGTGTATAVETQPLVCGDVVNSDRATSVTVPLNAGPPPPSQPGSPDQTASGHVLLGIVKGALQVTVAITDLAPGSSHAVSLDLGSCDQQGAMLHQLAPLVADATGYATGVTEVPGVTSIPAKTWDLVVRRTAAASTDPTDLDIILCGDIGGQTGV